MRIIGGSLAGQTIESPSGHRTHPMSEKVRGAIFNILGDIEGLTVLDAFAGSGALGIEAVSRGAKHATLIDKDKQAAQTAEANSRKLNLKNQVKVTQAGLHSWLANNIHAHFDLVFADPPYDDLQINSLNELCHHVAKDGLLVLSWPGHDTLPDFEGLTMLKKKGYGDAQLAFYSRAV